MIAGKARGAPGGTYVRSKSSPPRRVNLISPSIIEFRRARTLAIGDVLRGLKRSFVLR
jgi:hypothetical protein